MNNDFTCSLLVDASGLGLEKQEEIISDKVKSMNSGESICFITDNRDFSATISSLCKDITAGLSGFAEYGDMYLFVLGKH